MPHPIESSARIYQLKVTLKGAKPPVWRRLLVAGDATFSRLHDIFQAAMGWKGYHLHDFRVGRGLQIGIPDPEWDDFGEVLNEGKITLSALAPEAKFKFTYVYDFGDDWTHTVLVEKILPPDASVSTPVCVTGRRACPPEDCGGVWGYAELLEVLADPDDPERDERLEWLGGGWDAEVFDLDAVNERLVPLRKR